MSNLHETPSHIPDASAAKAAALEAMRAAMALYLTQLPILARGSWSHIARARKKLRALFKAERESFTQWALTALRNNADWQDRVRDELGGYEALRRWERRQRLSIEGGASEPHRPNLSKPAPTRTHTKRLNAQRDMGRKTDRLGLFRLAVISNGRTRPQLRAARGYKRSEYRPAWNFDIKPIAVTPDDLRGNRARSCESTEHRNPDRLWLDICRRIALWDNQINAVMTDVLCSPNAPPDQDAKTPP